MTDIHEVLFVCTHNAGRSQMAAAMLDHQAAGRVRVTCPTRAGLDLAAVRPIRDEIRRRVTALVDELTQHSVDGA